MTQHYRDIAFTPRVKQAQADHGSADAYGKMSDAPDAPDSLTEAEATFIAARDSFYMATVSETGWPYVQHRGGPTGFVKVLSPRHIGIADFRGNRQYVSLGNVRHDDRAALFFMDYPNRRRLKLFARVKAITAEDDAELIAGLTDESYGAKIERGLVFAVEAFDWNCPQHITPRYTEAEIQAIAAAARAQD